MELHGRQEKFRASTARSLILLVVLATTAPGSAEADSWRLPTEHEAQSPDGNFRFLVRPFPLEDDRQPVGEFYRTRPAEKLLWRRDLLNQVAPVSRIIADGGKYVATFDNWHNRGFGDHTIVVYDSSGSVVVDFRLTDVVSRSELFRFGKSVSSIRWGSGHEIRGDVLVLKLRLMPWELVDRRNVAAYRRWEASPGPPQLRRIHLPTARLLDPPEEHPINVSPEHQCPAPSRLFERQILDWKSVLHYCVRSTGGAETERHGPFRVWRATSSGWTLAETGFYEGPKKTGTWTRFGRTPPCEMEYEAGEVVSEANCD